MKKTVTKKEVVERMASKMGTTIIEADNAYHALVSVLAENILEGKGTSFRGVGKVTAEWKNERLLPVPTKEEPVLIPSRISCNFEVTRNFAVILRSESRSHRTSRTASAMFYLM